MESKVFCSLIVCIISISVVAVQVQSSAIPMWEFLSREEKMSFLYSMFANQVEELCNGSETHECNQELLKHGLGRLKQMSEEELDKLDPYQRGASNMIWETMLDGHRLMKTTPKPREHPTSTAKPNSYDDRSFGDEFGAQSAASAKIETVYRVPAPSEFVLKLAARPAVQYPNGLEYYGDAKPGKIFTRLQEQQTTETPELIAGGGYVDAPLTGPLVVKVYPDGRPVQEEPQPIPHDEDLRQYQLSKVKLPDF